MLRVLLGMRPLEDSLLVAPAIPKTIERIELLGIPGRWGRADAFGRGVIDLTDRARGPRRQTNSAAVFVLRLIGTIVSSTRTIASRHFVWVRDTIAFGRNKVTARKTTGSLRS